MTAIRRIRRRLRMAVPLALTARGVCREPLLCPGPVRTESGPREGEQTLVQEVRVEIPLTMAIRLRCGRKRRRIIRRYTATFALRVELPVALSLGARCTEPPRDLWALAGTCCLLLQLPVRVRVPVGFAVRGQAACLCEQQGGACPP